MDRTEVSGVTEHLRIFTGRLLLNYALPTPERWKSHTPGEGAVGGRRAAAGIGSLGYHWRLSLDTNLLLIPQLLKGLEFIPIRLRFYSRYPQKT